MILWKDSEVLHSLTHLTPGSLVYFEVWTWISWGSAWTSYLHEFVRLLFPTLKRWTCYFRFVPPRSHSSLNLTDCIYTVTHSEWDTLTMFYCSPSDKSFNLCGFPVMSRSIFDCCFLLIIRWRTHREQSARKGETVKDRGGKKRWHQERCRERKRLVASSEKKRNDPGNSVWFLAWRSTQTHHCKHLQIFIFHAFVIRPVFYTRLL